MTTAIDDDMLTPDVIAEPYSYYGWIRGEDPVHWNEKYGMWVIHLGPVRVRRQNPELELLDLPTIGVSTSHYHRHVVDIEGLPLAPNPIPVTVEPVRVWSQDHKVGEGDFPAV